MANKNEKRQGSQTGSPAGNPRTQQVQPEQTSGDTNREKRKKDADEPRPRRGNSSGGDGHHGGNR